MTNKYIVWCNKFMESWKNLEGTKTTELFSKDVKYFENPIDRACESFEDIEKLWAIVPSNQKDIIYDYNILISDESLAIVNFRMTRTMIEENKSQEIDGIFQISLNNNGLCNCFKQWRFTRLK